jgi:hypothetical protein
MRFDPRDPRFQNPMMFNGGFYPGMQPGQAQYQQGIPVSIILLQSRDFRSTRT